MNCNNFSDTLKGHYNNAISQLGGNKTHMKKDWSEIEQQRPNIVSFSL